MAENPFRKEREQQQAAEGGNPFRAAREAAPAAPFMSAGEVFGQAAQNLGPSAAQFGEDIAALGEAETWKGLGSAIGGAIAKLVPDDMEPSWLPSEKHADAIGQFYADRYGSFEDLKRSFATDPVGVFADALSVVTGGGAAAARAPGLAGKIGRVAAAADPVAGATKAAAGAVGRVAPGGVSRKQFVRDAPTTEDLKKQGRELYQAAEAAGVAIPAEEFSGFLGDLGGRMAKEGVDRVLHPEVSRAVELAVRAEGGTPDLNQMQNMRRHLGIAAGKVDNPDQQRIASIAIDMLDDFMEGTAGEAAGKLGEARTAWGRMRRSQLIEETIEKASTRAAGMEAGLRNEFSKLYRNKKAMRGFSADEKAAIKAISEGNFTANTLRRLAALGPGMGQQRNMLNTLIGMGVGGGVGTGLGGPIGGAVGGIAMPLLGAGAGRMSARGTRSRADLARAMTATGETPAAAATRSPNPAAIAAQAVPPGIGALAYQLARSGDPELQGRGGRLAIGRR